MTHEPISLQTIQEGLQQIKTEMISHLDSKLDTINQSLNKIEGSVAILGEHVTELEQRVSSNEDDVMDLIRVKTLEN